MKLRTLLSFSAIIPFMALAELPENYPGLPFNDENKGWLVPEDGSEIKIKAADFDYVPGDEPGKANEVIGQGITYTRTQEMTNKYRPTLKVRITDDGDHMENQANGNWTCYTFNFPSDGLYKFAFTGSSGANNSRVYFTMDGRYDTDGNYIPYAVGDVDKGHRENPIRVNTSHLRSP